MHAIQRVGLVAALSLAAVSGVAHAGGVSWSVGVNVPGPVYAPPVYQAPVYPAPVYVAPPVYAPARTVYVAPPVAPVYYGPPPVVYGPALTFGVWGGGHRYYRDGRHGDYRGGRYRH